MDVPTNQNIGGDTSPASPAGLTPMDMLTSIIVTADSYCSTEQFVIYFTNIYLCAFSQINKRFTAPSGSWTDYPFIATKLNGHRSENKLNFTRKGIKLFMYYFVHNC